MQALTNIYDVVTPSGTPYQIMAWSHYVRDFPTGSLISVINFTGYTDFVLVESVRDPNPVPPHEVLRPNMRSDGSIESFDVEIYSHDSEIVKFRVIDPLHLSESVPSPPPDPEGP